jgi:hypothetical protein
MRPPELDQLINDLREEKPRGNTFVQPQSKLIVVIDDDAKARYVFDADECRLLLADPDSASRLFEALDYPEETFIELHDLAVDPEVMSELEKFASTVDEI